MKNSTINQAVKKAVNDLKKLEYKSIKRQSILIEAEQTATKSAILQQRSVMN